MDLGLSKRGEYVVRSALGLARAYPSGTPLKLRQVSDEMGVPRTFASQILGDLVHAGLAVSSFGVRGGYRLARPPDEVNLLEVVEAGEGPLERAECGMASSCPWRADCPLLDTFSAATVRVRATLTGTTLADLVRAGWSEAEAVCPVRAGAVDGAATPGPQRAAGDLVRRAAGCPTVPGGDRPAPSQDVGELPVERPVDLLGDGVTGTADRRPQGGGDEGGRVPQHDDQGDRHDGSHDDHQPAGHALIVSLAPPLSEPRDLGSAGPRRHGAVSVQPAVRNSPETAGEVPQGGEAPDGVARPDRHPGRRITVVIVDDHVLVREGSKQLLEAEPDIAVVGVAGTGEDGLALIERLRPDVALVDINLPGISGLELARQVRDGQLPTRVLVLSAYDDYGYVAEAVDVGVGGYLLKTASAQELVDSLRLVFDGVTVFDRAVSSRLRHRLGGSAPVAGTEVALTPREVDVLHLLADGRTNKEIGAALHLGLRTVESHVSSVLAKLGASSRTQAVAFALRHQLVPADEHHRESAHGGAVEHR